MTNLPLIFCVGLLLTGAIPGVAGAQADESERADFRRLMESYYAEYAELFPLDVIMNGDETRRFDAVWPNDLTADHRARVGDLAKRYLATLKSMRPATLSPADQLSSDVMQWRLQQLGEGAAFPFHLLPVNQFWSAPLLFAQMGSGAYLHPFKRVQDYRNFIERGKGFNAWVDSAIANLREGVARGIVQPRVLMERVLPQLDALMTDDPAKNPFYLPLRTMPAALAPEEKDALVREYRAGLQDVIFPAYARLHAFIRDDYILHTRDTAGLSALPGGDAMYTYLVRLQTTTTLTPSEIHDIGLREVARIRGEMDQVRRTMGFAGDLPEFLESMATDPRYRPFRSEAEILAAYRAIEGRVMAAVPRFFGHVPRTRFEIRATEKFRVAAASHEYSAGTPNGDRPGIFFVPIVTPESYPSPRMENLFLHEAIPGHHFQISLALENPDLPQFRRYDANNAYVEGWALYTESLGGELGLYTDPVQRFGMLLGEMQRAVRLVVDTGLHAQGWSRERALAYAAENEGGTPESHGAKIERYMAAPGQALGYKIGQLKIRAIRVKAELALGPRFDLRAFHDALLAEGALPLGVLETHMDRWTETQARR